MGQTYLYVFRPLGSSAMLPSPVAHHDPRSALRLGRPRLLPLLLAGAGGVGAAGAALIAPSVRRLVAVAALLACLLCLPASAAGADSSVSALSGHGGPEGVTLACGATNSGKPRTRFAYALMHYEGTERDKEYVLGTRVLIQSLLASGTQQDIVILASKTVSQKSIDRFCADGVIVEVRAAFICGARCAGVCAPRRASLGQRLRCVLRNGPGAATVTAALLRCCCAGCPCTAPSFLRLGTLVRWRVFTCVCMRCARRK
jgi:hypothetical protein